MTTQKNDTFAALFKKYRLRSEISTLSEFAELMAKEGLHYEPSLYTHWQRGDRTPRDRKTLLGVIKVFISKKGIASIKEANALLEVVGERDLNEHEIKSLMREVNEIPFKAPLASIAELLKTYRLQRNFSQYEVALSAGLKDATRIEEIEAGLLENPSRSLMDKIFDALGLQVSERNAILLAGNYLPTDAEIHQTRLDSLATMENWPYPALLYDFSWRIIMTNEKFRQLAGIEETTKTKMDNTVPTAIEIVFDPNFINNRYLKGKDVEVWHRNLLRFIVHFRALHKSITKQKWYIELIRRMMKSELFRQIWQKAQRTDADLLVTRHGYKVFFDPKVNKRFTFNIFVVPLLRDPRFELEFFTPADQETFNHYQHQL